MAKKSDDSWDRFPDVKIRMREDGLETILDGLGEDGFCHGSEPKIRHLDDGVYIDIMLNVGKYGSVIALPFEIFIPVEDVSPKKKAAKTQVEASDAPLTVPEE